MLRRKVSLTLLAVLAVQMLASMAFATVCLEPCPDDTENASCPPICTLCMTCTHAQTAIVQDSSASATVVSARNVVRQRSASPSSQLAADIFHVPLLG